MGTYLHQAYENSIIKFSIIVPVYNVEKFLRECLDSIASQTLKEFEVICINDGSTDNSLEILNEYATKDKRFIVLSQKNQGQGIARNNAINIAQGKYLLFVDPDDWIETNTLEEVWNKFEVTDANIVQFNYEIHKDVTKKRKSRISHIIAKKKYAYNLKRKGFFNWQVFKKDMFRSIGLAIWNRGYRTDFIKNNKIEFAPNKHGEDHIFTIKSLILTEKVFYLNKILYHYRNRANSSVNIASADNFSAFDNIKILKEFLEKKNLINDLQNEFEQYKFENLACHYRCIPNDNMQSYLKLCQEILSEQEFQKFLEFVNSVKLSFTEKVFSLKNNKIGGHKYKVLTIFGVSINLNKPKMGEC